MGRTDGGDDDDGSSPLLRLGADVAMLPPSLDCRGIAGQPVWSWLCTGEGRVSGVELPFATASIKRAVWQAYGGVRIAGLLDGPNTGSSSALHSRWHGPCVLACFHVWWARRRVWYVVKWSKRTDLGRWIFSLLDPCIALDHAALSSRPKSLFSAGLGSILVISGWILSWKARIRGWSSGF